MPSRFFRRFIVAPGFAFNVSRSGISTKVGPRGLRATFGPRGIRPLGVAAWDGPRLDEPGARPRIPTARGTRMRASCVRSDDGKNWLRDTFHLRNTCHAGASSALALGSASLRASVGQLGPLLRGIRRSWGSCAPRACPSTGWIGWLCWGVAEDPPGPASVTVAGTLG
jgi:hypothetical protein